jgi:hypothetical protein
MPQAISTTLLRGGLNLIVPAIAMKPGNCIAAQNYEPQVRGYSRIDGYERFDGRPQPHKASYSLLNFVDGSTAVTAGQTVTGATSGASGVALYAGTLSAGSYGGSDASGYLVLFNVTGTFEDGENLQVFASTVAVANGDSVDRGAETDELDRTWSREAVTQTRAAIQAIPGSGPVRGVCVLLGAIYGFRDNSGGTACIMHKSTPSGWVAQSLGHIVNFTTGTAEYKEGETLTQGGVTSTIRRVVLLSGTWSGGDAAGYVVVSGISGGNYTSGVATTATGSATLSGAEVANALPPGGRYSFKIHNFYGAGKTDRMYGANGVGRAFEWDGTYFTPINTGLSDALDKPTRVSEFSNHLFLGYAHGEIQFSGIGEPLDFKTISGAGSFTFGTEVTDMSETAATALVVFGRNKIAYLAGSDSVSFALTTLSDDAGSIPWTQQTLDSPIYQDDAGVRRMTTTQAYGNWRLGTLTEAVEPLFNTLKRSRISSVGSLRVKAKDQYRVFFSDGSGLIIYLGRSPQECMPFRYPFVATCTASGSLDSLSGEEQLFAGDAEGFVYQIDVGTSFDGAEINAYILFPFNAVGAAMQNKRFHRAVLEMDSTLDTTIALTAEYAYGDPDQPAGSEQSFDLSGGGGFWNVANWNQIYWSAPVQGIASAELEGVGRNVAIGVLSDAIWQAPHTLSSISIYYTPRGVSKTGK